MPCLSAVTLHGMRLRLLLSIPLLYATVPAVAHTISPQACERRTARPVHAYVLSAAERAELLRSTKKVKLTALTNVVPALGFALPGIVVQVPIEGTYNTRENDLHELYHQYQYRRDGAVTFLTTYAFEFHELLAHGCSYPVAYRSIGYEREADAYTEVAVGEENRQAKVDLRFRIRQVVKRQ